jgi:hypothetical protein
MPLAAMMIADPQVVEPLGLVRGADRAEHAEGVALRPGPRLVALGGGGKTSVTSAASGLST